MSKDVATYIYKLSKDRSIDTSSLQKIYDVRCNETVDMIRDKMYSIIKSKMLNKPQPFNSNTDLIEINVKGITLYEDDFVVVNSDDVITENDSQFIDNRDSCKYCVTNANARYFLKTYIFPNNLRWTYKWKERHDAYVLCVSWKHWNK